MESGDQPRNRRNRAVRIPNVADEPKRRELARPYCQPRAPIDLLVVKDTPVKEAIGSPRAHRPDSNQVKADLSRSDRPLGGVGRTFTFLVRRNDHRICIILCARRYVESKPLAFCLS